MSSWRSLILRIGDKSPEYGASSDFKEHIVRSLFRFSSIIVSLPTPTLSLSFLFNFSGYLLWRSSPRPRPRPSRDYGGKLSLLFIIIRSFFNLSISEETRTSLRTLGMNLTISVSPIIVFHLFFSYHFLLFLNFYPVFLVLISVPIRK